MLSPLARLQFSLSPDSFIVGGEGWGEGWGEGALVFSFGVHQSGFERPLGARVTFSLSGHARAGARTNGEAGPNGRRAGCPESRVSNPRERPPRWRALRPSMGYGCAGGLRGFSTERPCTGEKLARIHASHPADFPSPTRRAIGAPGEAARSCAQKQQQEQEHPTPALPCRQGRGFNYYFNALYRKRCGFAPSSPRRRFLSSSYSR